MQLYEAVRAEGRVSRASLAKALRVSPGSVTPAVADLIGAGLLREVADAAPASGRGRPPVTLAVEPGAALVAGLRLSDREHTAALIDAAGRTVASASAGRAPGDGTVAALVEEAGALLDRLLATAGVAIGAVRAVGVGLPGLVEHGSGTLRWSPIAEGTDAPLAALLSDRMGVAASVDNDTNLLTVAELWFGKGRGLSDFAVVTVENGVGMGLVVGHATYRGARGVGMELGHLCVELDGALCRCGRRGCLEAYVADYALEREAGPDLPEGEIVPLLEARMAQGDPVAGAVLEKAARYLALGLGNVSNLFDPRHVILSGSRSRWSPADAATLAAAVAAHTLSAPPPIEVNAWDDLIWARGAAALALSDATPGLVA
ncbi:ROK family protein [Jannaschia sp. Os4]|nr:ROK family protein [Jannaschia sp. Os4]